MKNLGKKIKGKIIQAQKIGWISKKIWQNFGELSKNKNSKSKERMWLIEDTSMIKIFKTLAKSSTLNLPQIY